MTYLNEYKDERDGVEDEKKEGKEEGRGEEEGEKDLDSKVQYQGRALSNLPKPDRQAIDRLLSEHRSEIIKLGFLRQTHRMAVRANSNRVPGSSPDSKKSSPSSSSSNIGRDSRDNRNRKNYVEGTG
jgi:hypothetical protein